MIVKQILAGSHLQAHVHAFAQVRFRRDDGFLPRCCCPQFDKGEGWRFFLATGPDTAHAESVLSSGATPPLCNHFRRQTAYEIERSHQASSVKQV